MRTAPDVDVDVDVAVVLTPDSLHHAQALAACAASKHLFRKKLLGCTGAKANEIVATVEAARAASFVSF